MPSSAEAPWKSLQLTLSNDSSTFVRVSPGHPPVLRGCTYSGPSASSSLEGGATTQLECEDAVHEGSAFLTYFVGDSRKKIVIWLSMKPGASAAEIRVGIFDEHTKLDLDVLEKVAKDEIKPATLGLGRELHWKIEDDEGKHEIRMIVDIGVSTDLQLEARLHIRDPALHNKSLTDVQTPIGVNYKVDSTFVGELLGLHLDPVHEIMAIAALIGAGVDGFNKDTTYMSILGRGRTVEQPASWEFIRGVLWNDDPACYFFGDSLHNNGSFTIFGGDWYSKYKAPGPDPLLNITHRSHFGDLQFLHAMASTVDETAGETKGKIMVWLEVMYKLAVDEGIKEDDRIDSTKLTDFFNDNTIPKGSDSLKALLMGLTPSYKKVDIKRRALGTCFHLIQDSYAVGHCERSIYNPEDMIDVVYRATKSYHPHQPLMGKIYIKGFPKDKPGRFGAIANFHCYKGQSHKHSYYDEIPNDEELVPSDLSSFSCIVGAADAIADCTKLAKWFTQTEKWEVVAEDLDVFTFLLVDKTNPSNVEVDDYLWRYKKPVSVQG